MIHLIYKFTNQTKSKSHLAKNRLLCFFQKNTVLGYIGPLQALETLDPESGTMQEYYTVLCLSQEQHKTSTIIRVLNVHYSTWHSKDYTSQIMSLNQWCHCEWDGPTLNWCWKAISWFWWSLFFTLIMATLRLVAAICVSPHVTDSKIASWINTNCTWTIEAI